MPSSAVLRLARPFDLPLSLAAAASFLPRAGAAPTVLRVGTHIDCRSVIIEIRQTSRTPPVIEASSTIPICRCQLLDMARWLVSAELDLRPFYRIAAPHPIMGPITKWLRGLKPLRPLSLFEMAIVAITEQQLSLAAAFHIRTRTHKSIWHADRGPLDLPKPGRVGRGLAQRPQGLWAFSPESRVREGNRNARSKRLIELRCVEAGDDPRGLRLSYGPARLWRLVRTIHSRARLGTPGLLALGRHWVAPRCGEAPGARPAPQPTATRAGTFALRTIPRAGRLLFVGGCTSSAGPTIVQSIVSAGDDWSRTGVLDHRAARDRRPFKKGASVSNFPNERKPTMWWLILLLTPLLGVLWVPFFHRVNPQLWGIPFFFWYQGLWVVIGAGIAGFVARMVATKP